ncbi:MAG: CoA pyrophosphatase [Planctomycetes bacterium]|nr:CoA pyrophosphatase [Planctomycetota bacterium]
MVTTTPNENLPELLRRRLAQPLPGIAACTSFSPELSYGRHHGPPAHDARQAAVLLLLYPGRNSWHLPLTVRPTAMSSHGGQVSFPGGEIELGETFEQAALRECCEELGEAGSEVQLLGSLSPLYVFASNFQVTPCVAWSPTRPHFEPNSDEVANLLEPSIVDLLNPVSRGSHLIDRRGIRFQTPHIAYDDYKIWGATSVILLEFLQLVSELAR